MISHAAATDIPIAHPITPPKFAKIEYNHEIKVIKEKWGQYFAIDHFCTPLCSNRNGNIVIKKF